MKITLSFEKTQTKDTSIMVDALRASTTITLALNNFNEIIPCFTPEEAFELKKEINGIIAGERSGKRVEGFDVGNSPKDVENYDTDIETLILTTSNGTRILKDMDSTVLVGSMVNAKAVGYKSVEIAENEIDVVMAGYKGNFALEDFLAAGEILYWICDRLNNECEISDYAKAAIMARLFSSGDTVGRPRSSREPWLTAITSAPCGSDCRRRSACRISSGCSACST